MALDDAFAESMAERNPPTFEEELDFKLHPEPADHDRPVAHPHLHQLDERNGRTAEVGRLRNS